MSSIDCRSWSLLLVLLGSETGCLDEGEGVTFGFCSALTRLDGFLGKCLDVIVAVSSLLNMFASWSGVGSVLVLPSTWSIDMFFARLLNLVTCTFWLL